MNSQENTKYLKVNQKKRLELNKLEKIQHSLRLDLEGSDELAKIGLRARIRGNKPRLADLNSDFQWHPWRGV